MNDMKKGGDKGDPVTPISPEVAKERFKAQMVANFRKAKPEQLSLMAEAMNDVLIERDTAFKKAEKSAEEELEGLSQFDENEEEEKKTLGARTKDWTNDHASRFSEGPIRYLIGRIINRWVIVPLTAASALSTGVSLYSQPEAIRPSQVLGGPFSAAGEFISNGAGFVYNNSAAFISGAAAALGASIFKRPTWKKKARRASYAFLVASSPTLFNDVWANLENGAKTLAEAANPSITGAVLAGATALSFVASWFLSDEIRYSEEKETSPKEPSKIGEKLGAAGSAVVWGIYNAIGTIVRLPGKVISAIRGKKKESTELAPTIVTRETESPSEPEEAAVEPTTADGHPTSTGFDESMNEDSGETEEDADSGDVLIPLD